MKFFSREKLYEIVFEADTFEGRVFDLVLIITILISIITVMLESMPDVKQSYGHYLRIIEWVITILFSIEYFLRIFIVGKPFTYILSFFGIIDLLSILPTYLALMISGTQALIVIRALRLLRIFRILKISRYILEARILLNALKESRVKISVFLFSVSTLVIIIGSSMYLIEGEESGFISIPKSIYWAIVTLTTVGYGDLTPQTAVGQFFSSLVMIIGYAIIAVPTGIVTVELARSMNTSQSTQVCPTCLKEGHDKDARYCKYCGAEINSG